MKSMSKLGSMVAVALMGATWGVGTSFGWWQESKPKERVDVPKTEVKRHSIRFEGSHQELEHLIRDLESEVKELEANGKHDAAKLQRRILERLQKALASNAEHGKIQLEVVASAHQHPGENQIKIMGLHLTPGQLEEIEKLTERRRELQQKFEHLEHQSDRKKLEAAVAEISARLNQLHTSKIGARWMDQGLAVQSGGDHKHIESPPIAAPQLHVHLQQVAAQLEKSGQMDAAQRIREGAARIQKDLQKKHDVRIEYRATPDESPSVVVITKNSKEVESGPKVRVEGAKVHASDSELMRKPGIPRKMAPQPNPGHQELVELLTGLRREITQLREEVRDLRQAVKRDPDRIAPRRDHDDDLDGEGKPRAKRDAGEDDREVDRVGREELDDSREETTESKDREKSDEDIDLKREGKQPKSDDDEHSSRELKSAPFSFYVGFQR